MNPHSSPHYCSQCPTFPTGVVEGTCGSLVRDRMEQSGMRWSIDGAQAVLVQRAVVKNGDWNDFWNFYIDSERDRLSPVEYNRAA